MIYNMWLSKTSSNSLIRIKYYHFIEVLYLDWLTNDLLFIKFGTKFYFYKHCKVHAKRNYDEVTSSGFQHEAFLDSQVEIVASALSDKIYNFFFLQQCGFHLMTRSTTVDFDGGKWFYNLRQCVILCVSITFVFYARVCKKTVNLSNSLGQFLIIIFFFGKIKLVGYQKVPFISSCPWKNKLLALSFFQLYLTIIWLSW